MNLLILFFAVMHQILQILLQESICIINKNQIKVLGCNSKIKYELRSPNYKGSWWYRDTCLIELNDGPTSTTFLHYYYQTDLADDQKASYTGIGLRKLTIIILKKIMNF